MDKIAYAELDCIFNQLDTNDLSKIPMQVIQYFKENKDKNYHCNIDLHIPLEKQNLHLKTIQYLCAINYLYLSAEHEQEELRKIYEENDKTFSEKTNIDKLFEKGKSQNMQKYSSNSENALTVYEKTSFVKTIINKIRNLFKKK